MGDRKVSNKYIPWDYDEKLVPRGKKLSAKDGTVPVRMMLPFSVQCDSCKTFLYRGTKFNSKKEPMGGADGMYLNIQRFRFYIKCVQCKRTISFLTDPKNADYEMESGGFRNYEVYKDKAKTEEESALEKEEDEKEDPLRALENRVLDSQREVEDHDNLEAIQAMNRKNLKLLKGLEIEDGWGADTKNVLAWKDAKEYEQSHSHLTEHGTTEEEESLLKTIQFGQKKRPTTTTAVPTTTVRLSEKDERAEEERRKQAVE
ncbi:MAG: hypothetical protein SGARI_006450, partial [Bacillariaceae sp.]